KDEEKKLITGLKELEIRRKDVDGQLKATEAKLVDLKTKQASVKKQDEYEALNNEIANCQKKISDFEDLELGLLEEIDKKHADFEIKKKELEERAGDLDRQKAYLKQQQDESKKRLDVLVASVEKAEKEV